MKNTKKILLGLGATAAVATPIVATVSCSLFGGKSGDKSSRQFYNYVDYMDEDLQGAIGDAYTYSTFDDLPAFKQAINDGSAAAGIGSDYFNAMLADQGLIQKIDFGRLYGITNDRSQWATVLEKYYTPEAWKLLKSFELVKRDKNGDAVDEDGNVTQDSTKFVKDLDGDGVEDHLWEYMAPYFMQNKVIAVNINDIAASFGAAHGNMTADQVKALSNADFNAKFTDKSYAGILAELIKSGVTDLSVNNYMRDNMMIGSEKLGKFTSEINNFDEGQKQIAAFFATIGQTVDGKTLKNHPIASGVDTLESITNKAENGSKISQAALMYNGDALAAFNGGYEKGGVSGEIRIINPENPTFMLDGFVISSDIAGDRVEMNRIYDVAQNILYKGINTSYVDANGANPFAAYKSENNVYKNFASVQYTAAFNQLYKYVEADKNFFADQDDVVNANAKAIFGSTRDSVSKIDKDHITSAISENLTIQLSNEYDSQKW